MSRLLLVAVMIAGSTFGGFVLGTFVSVINSGLDWTGEGHSSGGNHAGVVAAGAIIGALIGIGASVWFLRATRGQRR